MALARHQPLYPPRPEPGLDPVDQLGDLRVVRADDAVLRRGAFTARRQARKPGEGLLVAEVGGVGVPGEVEIRTLLFCPSCLC
jgi:hypothetical protein